MAFGELCKLLFVKIQDEKTPRRNGEPYQFQIKTHEPSRKLAERIRALYETQKSKDPEVFTETIKLDDAKLRTVVSHMESVNFSDTDLDTKGVAFEQFMDGFFKGDSGQYFTPREIIAFAVDMMLDERDSSGKKLAQNEKYILDPACGSGGFLLHALDYLRKEADDFYPDQKGDPAHGIEEGKEHYKHWHDFARGNLYGIEKNGEIARVAKMNMIIHDDGHTNVVGENALAPLNQIRQRTGNNRFKEGAFDLVLTNPPFGAKVTQTEQPFLRTYDLGKQVDAKGKEKEKTNQKTEILFIERVWQFLKPGTGRAAVVLPDGVLTNSSLQYVRDFLLERFQLLAVVSLPQTAFAHFGAGVKASLVFLRRRAEDEKPKDSEAIFMAAPEQIGYDATGRKCENQLPEVVAQYRAFERDPKPFFV